MTSITFINTIIKEYYENADKSLYSIFEKNYQRVIGFNSSNEKNNSRLLYFHQYFSM